MLLEVAASPTRSPLGWGVLGVGSGALGPRARWVAGLGLVAGAVSDGEGRGAQLLAPLVRLGPATDLGRAGAWRLGGMVSAGPVFVAPQAAVQLSGPSVVPGARAEASLTWSGRGALAIGAFVDAPLIRVVVVDMSEDRRLSEGIVRAGIRVGVGGELGRSE